MLEKFRNFSKSIFAKIFLFIVAIPFVFWGMGDLFSGGNLNTIVKIDNDKVPTEKFIKYIRENSDPSKNIDKDEIETFLSSFIGMYLMEKEQKIFKIVLSDNSLAKIIRNQEFFKEENKFSRTKYEKFLITNKMSAISFEEGLVKQENKKQLLDFVGGGIKPSNFMIINDYNKINQKRSVDIINLNELAKKKLNISENKIKDYFNLNQEKYKIIYKSVNLIELKPKSLINSDEFSELFFSKIDKIDDLISEGKNLKYILEEFNLDIPKIITLDKFGNNKDLTKDKRLTQNLVTRIFKINNVGDINLIEDNNKYLLLQLTKNENVDKNIKNDLVRKEIIDNIANEEKIKIVVNILTDIKKGDFKKLQFLNTSNENKIPIKRLNFINSNDESALQKELVQQIYRIPDRNIGVVYNNNFKNAYLVYVDKIENVSIEKDTEEFKKYSNLSKLKLTNDLYGTYDNYLKNKYKIKINYNALNNIKNYF